jgi:outer membrane lipoprotein-sorting protein
MSFKRSLLLAVAAALLASTTPAYPALAGGTTPALTAFDQAFAQINDYTYNLRAHEVQGSNVQDRVYAYSFMKPHFAKTLITSGDGNGSGGVWAGGDQVSGHQGGFLSGIHLKVGLHDGRATSMLGYTIPDGLMQTVVARYKNVAGDLSQHVGGRIDGAQTDVVTLVPSNPSAQNNGATRDTIYFSQANHLPLREILYVGSTVILDQSFLNVKTNTGLTQNDFPF